MPTRVLIVCGVRLYRDGLSQALCDRPELDVVGTASDYAGCLDHLGDSAPDVILWDTALDEMASIVQGLRQVSPDARVVALAVQELEKDVVACAEAGVSGYVSRDASVDDLVENVQAVVKGELHCSPRIAHCLLNLVGSLASEHREPDPVDCLSRRELEVLDRIEAGSSNKEIARSLHIEVATVKNHVHSILEKLHVQRRGEAAALLRRRSRGSTFRETMSPSA